MSHFQYTQGQMDAMAHDLAMVTSVKDDAVRELAQVGAALTEMTQAWRSVCRERDSLIRVQHALSSELDTLKIDSEENAQAAMVMAEQAEIYDKRIRSLKSMNAALTETANDYSSRLHEAMDNLAQEKRMSMALAQRCNEHLRSRRNLATAYLLIRRTARIEEEKRRQAEAHCDMLQSRIDSVTKNCPGQDSCPICSLLQDDMTHACVSCGAEIIYGTLHTCNCPPAPDKGSARHHTSPDTFRSAWQ